MTGVEVEGEKDSPSGVSRKTLAEAQHSGHVIPRTVVMTNPSPCVPLPCPILDLSILAPFFHFLF